MSDARFARLRDADLSAASVLAAAGGWRGLVESALPGFVFLIVYTMTGELWISALAPGVLAAIGLLVRLMRREPLAPALGGLAALILSAVLALRSGNDADYFLPGFWTNGAYGAAMLVSALVGWPLIGVIAGPLAGLGARWRANRPLRRVMTWLTLAWAAFFAVRLAVQLPLYLAGQVEALAATKLLMGTPMYAVLLVVTVVLARAAVRRSGMEPQHAGRQRSSGAGEAPERAAAE